MPAVWFPNTRSVLLYNTACRGAHLNTLWTGDADLRLYIITVQDG